MTLSNQKYLFLLIKYTFSCVMCVVANYVENSMAYYLKAIVHEPHLTTPLACVPFFFIEYYCNTDFNWSVCLCVLFSIDGCFLFAVSLILYFYFDLSFILVRIALMFIVISLLKRVRFQWINDVRRFNVFITNATLSIDCVDGRNVIGYVSMITMCRSVLQRAFTVCIAFCCIRLRFDGCVLYFDMFHQHGQSKIFNRTTN